MNRIRNGQLVLPNGKHYEFEDICVEKDSRLEELVRGGVMPDMAGLAGWEFKGRNISTFSKLLNIRRFIKGFCGVTPEVEAPEELDGYNLWARQEHGLKRPWQPIMKDGKPWRHGFYKVRPVDPGSIDNKHPNALLIDYSLAENPFYHPGTVLKDYFVQVYEDNPDLLLGKVYAAIGSQRIFGGYFVMQRWNRSESD